MRVLAPFTVLAVPFLLEGCKGCSDNEIVPGDDQDDLDDDVSQEDPHDIGSWLSMKATPDGKPAIAYYDRTKDALGYAVGTVADDGSVTWAKEEVDSYPNEEGLNPGDAGKYASLAIAADGTAWIAYQDTTNGTLKYAKRGADGAWTTGIADVGGGSRSDAGHWASIALDGAGNPVIAHYDHGRGDLRVARWNGSAFTGAVVHEGTDFDPGDGTGAVAGDAGEYAKLLIGPDGTEYVAFYDRAWGALRLAVGGPSGYAVELVDDGGDVGQWPDLALDGTTLHVAYQDVGNQDLKLASGAPGAWTFQTLDAGDYVGADIALWVNGGGPAAVYFDGVNNDMKVARLRNDAWTSDTVTGSGAASGYHNETVEIGGVRYVACYDYTARTVWFSALP